MPIAPYFGGHVRRPDKDHIIDLKFHEHQHRFRMLQMVAPPAAWDSRTKGWIGPIKDQSQCGCHDDKTEVLTSNGWVRWQDYDWLTPLGTMNPSTGLLEFQPCLKKHEYDYEGPLYHASHKSMDFALTPNHRMFVRKWNQKRRTLNDHYTFMPISNLGWYVGLPHATSGWIGAELNRIKIGKRWFEADDFIALVALVLSDGWVGTAEGVKNTTSFCCFREDRKKMVIELAQRLGIKERNRKNTWDLIDPLIAQWFKQNCYIGKEYYSPYKKIPDLIKSLSQRQIDHFLKFFGDQHTQEGVNNDIRIFYSSSKRMIDDLQELLLRIGKRGTIQNHGISRNAFINGRPINSKHEAFSLVERSRDLLSITRKKNLDQESYKGKVYCATVPNGTLVTRRNGLVLVSSNSCWCFSGTGVVEAAYYKAGILKPDGSDALSEEYTLSCGRNGGCNGDDNTTVLDWAKNTGLPKTSDYGPYTASRGQCKWKQGMALYKINSWGFADNNGGRGVTPTQDIKVAIMTYGCVGCAVDAGFRDPGTGVISGRGSNIDHDVILVGWDDTKGNGGAWIMRNSWGCVPEDTEILTERGWISFKDVREDETVATLNPDTHVLEYQRITKRHEYDYNGNLWSYQAQGVDLLVTPNHRLYIGEHLNTRGSRRWKLIEAQDNRTKTGRLKKTFRMKKDADWKAPDLDFHRVGDHMIPMDVWLEFLGYFVSEGHASLHIHERPERIRNRGGVMVRETARVQTDYIIGISQKKEKNLTVIQRCLDQLPFTFFRSKNGWTTNNKALWQELSSLGKQPVRSLPDYVRAISKRQANILLDALILGDGTRGTQTLYYTSSGKLADDVQELALRAGFAADVSSINRVGRDNGSGGITRHIERQVSIKSTRTEPHPTGGWIPEMSPYQGKVYCVTVPNGIIYVRRNGKAVWTGNSNWANGGYAFIEYGSYSIGTEAVWAEVDPVQPPIWLP